MHKFLLEAIFIFIYVFVWLEKCMQLLESALWVCLMLHSVWSALFPGA